MPIYEYQCQSCDKVFEYMQRMSEDRKTVCEECEGKLERIISQSAFHLKGGGWYKDLYSSTKKDDDSKGSGGASASSKPSADSSDSASTASASSSDSSGPAAPAAPTKAKTSSSD